MKNLEMIKEDIKNIQKNFNPAKPTYKVFDKLINEDFTLDQMLGVLARIRGVDKYPDDLKNDFFGIINNLKKLKEEEIRLKEEKEKELREKQAQEEHTKELKDIIDSLEKGDLIKKKEKKLSKSSEDKNEVVENIEDNNKKLPELKVEENKKLSEDKILKDDSSSNNIDESEENNLENDEFMEMEYEPKTIPQKIFIALLVLVIITFIVMLLLFFFY